MNGLVRNRVLASVLLLVLPADSIRRLPAGESAASAAQAPVPPDEQTFLRTAMARAAARLSGGVHAPARGSKGMAAGLSAVESGGPRRNAGNRHPLARKWRGPNEGVTMTVLETGSSMRCSGPASGPSESRASDRTATFPGSDPDCWTMWFRSWAFNGPAVPACAGTGTCPPDGKAHSRANQGSSGPWQRVEQV